MKKADKRTQSSGSWRSRMLPARVREITNMEIAVTGIVACFLTIFYGLNLFNTFDSTVLQVIAVIRFLGSITVVALIAILRNNFPLWIAYIGALMELTAFVYFVGFTVNHEQVVFRLQEFPLIALYMSWLFPGMLTKLTVLPVLTFTITYSQLFGPAIGTEHHSGVLNVVSLVFFTIVGMIVGSYVKRNFKQQIEIDTLTGAYNRRALGRRGDMALLQGRKQHQPVSVVLVDMDGFKGINDRLGHAAGDDALRGLVRHLERSTRKSDLVTRLGGDEFVLLFPNTTFEEAGQLMQRIHASSEHSWSFGVATANPDDNLSMVILRADRAMYTFKRERTMQRD